MDICRFERGYRTYAVVAEEELKTGHKQSYWMWFIFPQLRGLGKNDIANYYGLDSVEETKLFYSDKFLRNNLRKLTKIVLKLKDFNKLEYCFGSLDTKKFHSCMTIFYMATKDKLFKKVLNKFFQGCLDKQTMILLNYDGEYTV